MIRILYMMCVGRRPFSQFTHGLFSQRTDKGLIPKVVILWFVQKMVKRYLEDGWICDKNLEKKTLFIHECIYKFIYVKVYI
jgi:hypothetical protein